MSADYVSQYYELRCMF